MSVVTHRLFVAVPLADPVRSLLTAYMEQIKPKLPFRKWVHPSDLHLTLQFLGDTPRAKLGAVAEAIKKVAEETVPFNLELGSPGVFGRPAEPGILWLGIGGDIDHLQLLQNRVPPSLEHLGFEPETRAYKPHLTIARSYSGNRPFSPHMLTYVPAPSTGHYPKVEGLSWTVDEIVLYESHLNRMPMYEIAARFPFAHKNNVNSR